MASVSLDKDSQKKLIGEYLKAADRFIKSTEYTKALDEVSKALALEQNNMYALAYKDRIKAALDALEKKEEEEKIKKIAADKQPIVKPEEKISAASTTHSQSQPQPHSAPSSPTTKATTQQLNDDLLAQIKKEAHDAVEKKSEARIEALRQEFAQTQSKLQQEIVKLTAQAKSSKENETTKTETASGGKTLQEQSENVLRLMFKQAWQDGVITGEERALLVVLKNAIEMTEEKFSALETEFKNEAYYQALREVWSDGIVNPQEAEFLETLRERLQISAEQHFTYESRLRKELQGKK